MPRPREIADPARVTVSFDRGDYLRVQAIAKRERTSNALIVRRAVSEWLRQRNDSGEATEPSANNGRY